MTQEVTSSKRALLIIDMQYDFIPPNGSLKVTGGDKIISKINSIRTNYSSSFDCVVLSMDWHPPHHCSFLTNNKERDPNAKLFHPCKLVNGNMQVMWPDHCVQGSDGSKLHSDLITRKSDKIVLKGMDPHVDSYSAFMDNDKKTKTALEGILKELNIDTIFCCGLAYDFCVGYTALDGKSLGFNSYIIKDCSASVSNNSEKEIEQKFEKNEIKVINLSDLENILK